MRQPLRIAVAQPYCTPHDVAANAAVHAAMIESAQARVVIFPELSLTGYELTTPTIAADDPRLVPIMKACAGSRTIALAGAPVRGKDNRDYIATLVIDGDGAAVAYRKMYLHPPESDWYSPGEGPAVLEVDGWRLGLAICRDSGIAEHVAATAAMGMDAYVAGTLFSLTAGARRDVRMRAIAVQHGVWVAAASFAGATGGYPMTSGGSGIWAPGGALIAQSGIRTGATAHATLRHRSGAVEK
ncbi:carbon-nitrogen hydrolase family protein [Nonomuraea basaltis]|uniref:carbon-nitrogen hydrolase family protein n=1 Tax=Nonomuraea basaltis TaxID=2495887 RepID=UPI00110C6EDF|nr:carbon-nitrogen hydrolase family protein [Nonomuraea basaltis]TMR90144.1 carbon-nitrogen hydrolase family protein [Nonomuraea basaltis]